MSIEQEPAVMNSLNLGVANKTGDNPYMAMSQKVTSEELVKAANGDTGDISEIQDHIEKLDTKVSEVESKVEEVTSTVSNKVDSAYVDQKIADLVGGAPETLDTLKELSDALADGNDAVVALTQQIGAVDAKVDAITLDSLGGAKKEHTHTLADITDYQEPDLSDVVKYKEFEYNDKGSMATVGRNRAVADLHKLHMYGRPAWVTWMFVHLISILGMRNKLTVLINWIWAYCTYSTSLRLLIRPSKYPYRRHWDLAKE